VREKAKITIFFNFSFLFIENIKIFWARASTTLRLDLRCPKAFASTGFKNVLRLGTGEAIGRAPST